MASIFIENSGTTISASPAVSILNNLLQSGAAISHLCGGKAMCGTCRIKILDGKKYLSPMNEREAAKLKAMNHPEGIRLACQTYTAGDIRIKIILEKPPAERTSMTSA